MKCYSCGELVSPEMHEEVQQILDEDCEKDYQGDPSSLANMLGLIHCRGSAENFDDAARVIVCVSCIDGARCDSVTLDDSTEEPE